MNQIDLLTEQQLEIQKLKRSQGHFEFWKLNSVGDEVGTLQKIMTDTGVILYCHERCDPIEIRHLCAIAYKTTDYPVDITLWEGPQDAQFLAWSARIYWRST